MPYKRLRRAAAASLIAACGLVSLSHLTSAAISVAALGLATPAWAQTTTPQMGAVIRKMPGNACCAIVAPSDSNGITRLTGLEPGDYRVRVLEGAEETVMRVGRDGRLAYASYESLRRADARAADPRARRAQPVVRRGAEPIEFGEEGGSGTIIAIVAAIRVNPDSSNADELTRGTANSPETARIIIADREKNGAFRSIEDFAARICPQTDVDFSGTSIRLGDHVAILVPAAKSKGAPGFQCSRADTGQFSLYGRKHNYVGHVTLLR